MTKFKKGDVVRVIDNRGDKNSSVGDVCVVVGTGEYSDHHVMPVHCEASGQNYFMFAKRFEMVTTNGDAQRMVRRTFKQLHGSVTVKRGALWQEACDDGDQEYILLDESYNKDSRNTQKIYDRSLVEGDSRNFVEVFKVNPEYVTREDLDRWTAFNKKPRKARVTKITVETPRLAQVVKAERTSKNRFLVKQRKLRAKALKRGGLKGTEIARKLGVSTATVTNYLRG